MHNTKNNHPLNYLVIINAPFHIVNALEALAHFNIEPSQCELCVTYPTDKQRGNTLKLVEEYTWRSVTVLRALSFTDDFGNLYARYKAYKRYINQWKTTPFDKIFITQYLADDTRNIINQFQSKEVVLLDEGNAVFTVVDDRRSGGDKSKAKKIKEMLFGLHLSEVKSLTFFTEYDIEPLPADRVIKSDNSWIKGQMKQIPRQNYTLFLGSAYAEDNFFEFDHYLQILQQAFKQIDNRIVYYPHRREDEANLRTIANTFPNVEIVRSTGPIELSLKKFDFLPIRIAGFYTAAISKIKSIMGEELEAFSFNFHYPPYFDEQNNTTIANIVKDLSAKGIQCIKLEEIGLEV